MKSLFKCFFIVVCLFSLCGCGSNANTTEWGGTKEIYLPDGMKFVNYNIQDSEMIWCTSRPMRTDEFPEVYIVQQDKSGIQFSGNGKFIVYESKDGVIAELPVQKEVVTENNQEQ